VQRTLSLIISALMRDGTCSSPRYASQWWLERVSHILDFSSLQTGMTIQMFDAARERGTAQKIGQLNPMGRYGVAEGK
jgi:hypothetical protein